MTLWGKRVEAATFDSLCLKMCPRFPPADWCATSQGVVITLKKSFTWEVIVVWLVSHLIVMLLLFFPISHWKLIKDPYELMGWLWWHWSTDKSNSALVPNIILNKDYLPWLKTKEIYKQVFFCYFHKSTSIVSSMAQFLWACTPLTPLMARVLHTHEGEGEGWLWSKYLFIFWNFYSAHH